MKRRLYLQVYLAFLGILFLFGALVTTAWYFQAPGGRELLMFDSISAMAGEVLPRADEPVTELQSTLERLSKRFDADLAVHDADGRLLASVGEALPAPSPQRERSGWIRSRRSRGAAAFRLPDGRWLVARHDHPPAVHVLWLFVLLAGAIALGSYPLARRITRRLERLQSRVDELGAGDLSARVKIEGNDEVAALARSFNQAASQIERLVNAQRHMLASASHELRSPLARMRLAIELLGGGEERPDVRARISKDIQELDDLIEELLLASRLDALEKLERNEDVDLLAILAEEGARSAATVTGEPVSIQGDPRMLRRLIRNLLDNARRYAAGSPIEASVVPRGSGALLLIADRGDGVPAEERENIFKPFYRPQGMREGEDRGVGLGLALVRQIARRHEGDARCLLREGGGTCFEVTLRSVAPV